MIDDFTNQPEENQQDIKYFEQRLKRGESIFLEMDMYHYLVEHYQDMEDFEKVLTVCQIAIEQHPFSVQPLLDQAQMYAQLGEVERAFLSVEKAENISPNDSETLTVKAWILQDAGKSREAIKVYRQTMPFTDTPIENLYQIAMLHRELNEFDLAIKVYYEILSQGKESKIAFVELIDCYCLIEKSQKAIDLCNDFIDTDPYNSFAWYQLGQLYLRIEKYKEATEALEYATLIDPKYESAYRAMAKSFIMLEDYQKAIDIYLHIPTIPEYFSTKSFLFCQIGLCQEKLHNYPAAIKNYHQASKENKKEAEAWAGLGKCFALQKAWEQARHFFQKAIDLKPKKIAYWLAKAEADFKIGHHLSAQETYQKVLSLEPENIEAYLAWSLVLDEQNKLKDAIALLNEALDFAPDNADLMYRLVAYLLKKGASKEATLYLELALVVDYDKHEQLYAFFDNLESQKAIFKLIEQLKP